MEQIYTKKKNTWNKRALRAQLSEFSVVQLGSSRSTLSTTSSPRGLSAHYQFCSNFSNLSTFFHNKAFTVLTSLDSPFFRKNENLWGLPFKKSWAIRKCSPLLLLIGYTPSDHTRPIAKYFMLPYEK